jgi:hypothetical protein
MVELLTHDPGITNPASQRSLVHDRPQHRRVPPLQDLLPLEPGIDLFLDLLFVRVGQRAAEHGPRVSGRLQQPWNTRELPGPQRQSLALDARPFPEPRRPDLPVQLIPQVGPQPQQRTAGTQLVDHVAAGGEVLGGHPPRRLHRTDQGGRVADPLAQLFLAQPRGRAVVAQLRAEQRERARTGLRVP